MLVVALTSITVHQPMERIGSRAVSYQKLERVSVTDTDNRPTKDRLGKSAMVSPATLRLYYIGILRITTSVDRADGLNHLHYCHASMLSTPEHTFRLSKAMLMISR